MRRHSVLRCLRAGRQHAQFNIAVELEPPVTDVRRCLMFVARAQESARADSEPPEFDSRLAERDSASGPSSKEERADRCYISLRTKDVRRTASVRPKQAEYSIARMR